MLDLHSNAPPQKEIAPPDGYRQGAYQGSQQNKDNPETAVIQPLSATPCSRCAWFYLSGLQTDWRQWSSCYRTACRAPRDECSWFKRDAKGGLADA